MIHVKVRQWLTKSAQNPLPMREMVGRVERETAKAVLLDLQGFITPTETCLHCGRTLTHPVSVLYGIGPICGKHFHINPFGSAVELERAYDEVRRKMAAVKWRGWVPKSSIEFIKPYQEVGLLVTV